MLTEWAGGGGLENGLNNTYKSLRVIGEDYDLAYTVWCSNEHELYEMGAYTRGPFFSLDSHHSQSLTCSQYAGKEKKPTFSAT